MRLRNRVRAARMQRGISITELARRTCLTRQTIYSIEEDSGYQPKADVMFRLSTALNQDIGSLFWMEPDRQAV